MTPRLPPCHSEPVTDVTGVGIRPPLSPPPVYTPCHSEPVTAVTGVGIRVPSFQIYPVFFNLLYRKIPILFHAFIR